jgi:hypothetical protein
MYFADVIPPSRDLTALKIAPLQIRQFRLISPSNVDCDGVRQMLDRQSQRLGARIMWTSDGYMALFWSGEGLFTLAEIVHSYPETA